MPLRKRKILARFLGFFHPVMGRRLRAWTTRMINPKGKLYIPRKLGVGGFFRALGDAKVQHVVLRWFEDLPQVESGHDVDILVSDSAVETVRSLLSEWPDGQIIDFYSVSGVHGTGYKPHMLQDVPVFPQRLASELLDTAEHQPGGWSNPNPRTHFLALAYHAVYMKGYSSGLPADGETPPHRKGSHDYAVVLTELAEKAGYQLEQPVTLASLDVFLRGAGWYPDESQLRAIAPTNSWIVV